MAQTHATVGATLDQVARATPDLVGQHTTVPGGPPSQALGDLVTGVQEGQDMEAQGGQITLDRAVRDIRALEALLTVDRVDLLITGLGGPAMPDLEGPAMPDLGVEIPAHPSVDKPNLSRRAQTAFG